MNEKKPQDEIIAEVRAIRDALAAKHGYDPERLYEEARRREAESGRELLEPTPKRLQKVPSP